MPSAFFSAANISVGVQALAGGIVTFSSGDSGATAPNNSFCPSSRARLVRADRARAESIAAKSWALQVSDDADSSLRESKAPPQTRPSSTRLLIAPSSTLSAKSNDDLNRPPSLALVIALTLVRPIPLIAAKPYLIAPLRGVNPDSLSLTSGGSSLIPLLRISFVYLKTLAVSSISFESTAA